MTPYITTSADILYYKKHEFINNRTLIGPYKMVNIDNIIVS